MIGPQTALKYAVKIAPYAVIYHNRPARAANASTGRLIFYFGDSSVAPPPWARTDTPRIPAVLEDVLADSYPELGPVTVVDWSFAGARLFHYYCLLFEAADYSPDLIIIPINWRNLGPRSWESEERFSFRELGALVPLSECTTSAEKAILRREGISAPKRFFSPLTQPVLCIKGLKTWGRIRLGLESEEDPAARLLEGLRSDETIIDRFGDKQLFEQYTLEVSTSNPHLETLRLLAETATRRRNVLLFYITPIHIDEMRQRKPFDPFIFADSVVRLANTTTFGTSFCLSLVSLLRETDFIDCFEHYTPEGNRTIARALAPEVRKLLVTSQPPPAAAATVSSRDSQPN
jgi:hypothetical protein